MIGDQADIFWRLRGELPAAWFPVPARNDDGSPANPGSIDALLWGIAYLLAFFFSLLLYTKLQLRIATATGGMLDLMAGDFYGDKLQRNVDELDASYSWRIRTQLLQPKVTRPAIAALIQSLAGGTPTIVEPGVPADCGGYGVPAFGYGSNGAYSLTGIPAQVFITIPRLNRLISPGSPGYGDPQGGYGVAMAWQGAPGTLGSTDAAVLAAILAAKAEGVTVWVRFVNPS